MEQPIVTDSEEANHTGHTTPATIDSPAEELDISQLYDLVQSGISGELAIDVLVHKLNKGLGLASDQELFVDTLADILAQCEIESSVTSKENHDNSVTIIKTIIKSSILPLSIALERFDVDTSTQLGIIPDKKQFMVSYNRLRTKLYFKQKKYNLLREENKGFAKILVELFRLDETNLENVLSTVIEIIGQYRVDPNRVLDLVLDALEYEKHKDNDIFIKFLSSFYNSPTKITQLIIVKLNFYANIKPNEQFDPVVSQSFYRLIAILMRWEILDIDDIYPHLKPTDSKILDYHKKLTEEARHFSRKYAMVIVGEEKPTTSVYESLSDEDKYQLEIDNQKINICLHLMNEGGWEQVLYITKKLPEFYVFQDRRVARSVCDFVSYLIDPLYRECALPRPLNLRIKPKQPRKEPAQVKTIDDLKTRVFPILTALGPFLSLDILTLTKIIRLLKHILLPKGQENSTPLASNDPLFYHVLDIINDSILPSMTLSGSNTSLARELWSLMKLFKYPVRYKLYYNWRDESSNPVLLRTRGHILLRAKHFMKRLSKDTMKYTGRQIGKLCYCNPIIALQYILVQVQSYDNLIGLVVDAFRFLPPIAIDAVIYCVIESLLDPHKNKKSMDGLAIAPWLTSLSTFSANIILRYKVDFNGFLEYISNQLKAGNSLDLILLTDLIQKMTGIETIQAIADDRLEALMGGDLLRTEGAYLSQEKRNTRKSSARLKETLIESRLVMPLSILMAQTRDSLFFNQQDVTHLKLVGNLYDQCQETFVQYGAFVSMNLSIDDYINYLPSIDKLMTDYNLDPDSTFFLARPMIMHKIKSKFNELRDSAIKQMTSEEGETLELNQQEAANKFIEAAKSVIDPIAEAVQPSLIEKYGTNNLNSKLFVIFWTLTMSDIDVPINCYEREIQRLKQASHADSSFGNSLTPNGVGVMVSSKPSSDEELKRRKERERCNNLIQRLKQEQAEQVEHAGLVKMYLESEKKSLFCERSGSDHVYLESRQFVQHCPLARSILSASDAIYSARFLIYLHELKVENFSTLICLDRLLCDLTYMMGACTENEAHHYGRFLRNILKITAHWHSDANIYIEECEKHPGSIINIENSDHITYENYRHICNKWHYRLTRAFTVALESNNYIQIRNALIVMIAIIDHYPAIKHFGRGIMMKIEEVRTNEKDSRPDLYALASSYAVKLDEKKPHLIPEGDFHHVENAPASKERHHSSSSSSRKKPRHS